MSMEQVEDLINSYGDWRTKRLLELKDLIQTNAPELTEDFKWGVPVWSCNGLVCAVSGFKDHVKMNFFKGAYLSDPDNVFNSGLDSKEHRSINLGEFDPVPENAISDLIKAAITLNSGK